MRKILAVVPARGGSKGIPRKNLRLLRGKPLLYYAIQNALKSQYITDVVVSTEDDEIAYVAGQYGADVVRRGIELADDTATLDPVVFHAVCAIEEKKACSYDAVVTLQPTSPLLTVKTLDAGISFFLEEQYDTVISGTNRPHLAWGKENGAYYPLYRERLNRQSLPGQYVETGAFLITRRDCVAKASRIGARVSVFEVPEQESVDIDTQDDWILAQHILGRKKIIFRADGHHSLGLGHIYNCITMAYSMIGHDILILTRDDAMEGIAKLKETYLPYRFFHSEQEMFEIIREVKPDIWVNDCLNTTEQEILALKETIPRVITIEDLGTGIRAADAVINALYDPIEGRNVHSGYRYVCLREEFQLEQPRPFSEEVSCVLVMFGGTDPLNLNRRVYQSVRQMTARYPQLRFVFLPGIGYDCDKNGVVTRENERIFVHRNVPRVTKYMREADLAITSQGRTVFELAAMGIPSIVVSQNARETTHSFARMEHGFLNLGLGTMIEQTILENTLHWLISTPAVRKNMHDLMIACPLRDGIDRVRNIILGENE